jgi:hypothetical protein
VVPAGKLLTVFAECEPGDRSTGGGFSTPVTVLTSAPNLTLGDPIGWEVTFRNKDGLSHFGSSFAVCADLSP